MLAATQEQVQAETQENVLGQPQDEWVRIQQEDGDLTQIWQWVARKHLPSKNERKIQLQRALSITWQVVVPVTLLHKVALEAYEKGAHFGQEKTYQWLQKLVYHPLMTMKGNGACERFNQTLIQILKTLEEDRKIHWPDFVAELVWVYNNRVHRTTGYTPYTLLFSRPVGAGFFFVEKKDGGLRPCIDYRELNAITIKNQYPLPLIPDLFNQLMGARWFTKLDLRGAYNLVRIRDEDEWKTAFNTPLGHFEYLVMPFGLSNAPAVFQHFVNDIFRDICGVYVVVYLDDILIYSADPVTHAQHVRSVLQRLREHSLFAKLEKCVFFAEEVQFLGYVVSSTGFRMDPAKIQPIKTWVQPKSLKALQRFLGFANYYRKFIRGFSEIAKHISMDFITDLPPSEGKTCIWVVVDRFSKQCHFVPLSGLPNSETLSKLFIVHVIRLHGAPENIVSDRGTQFVSKFWRAFCKRIGIELSFSSAYHPETNGQTERTNQALEQYLRCYVSEHQSDWAEHLPLAEFALNNQYQESIKTTPFFCNHGLHPRFGSFSAKMSELPGTNSDISVLKR
ncbi:uncharacterized protein [Dendrobates tinctorius]|uniref:uncharacterized protein n=1 Tax=Dendrobates tinctorius TaxID=92724 RepID=UPI003CC9F53A